MVYIGILYHVITLITTQISIILALKFYDQISTKNRRILLKLLRTTKGTSQRHFSSLNAIGLYYCLKLRNLAWRWHDPLVIKFYAEELTTDVCEKLSIVDIPARPSNMQYQ